MRLLRSAAALASAALTVVLVAGPAGAVLKGTTDTPTGTPTSACSS
jgi:hypothetical protein